MPASSQQLGFDEIDEQKEITHLPLSVDEGITHLSRPAEEE